MRRRGILTTRACEAAHESLLPSLCRAATHDSNQTSHTRRNASGGGSAPRLSHIRVEIIAKEKHHLTTAALRATVDVGFSHFTSGSNKMMEAKSSQK